MIQNNTLLGKVLVHNTNSGSKVLDKNIHWAPFLFGGGRKATGGAKLPSGVDNEGGPRGFLGKIAGVHGKVTLRGQQRKMFPKFNQTDVT